MPTFPVHQIPDYVCVSPRYVEIFLCDKKSTDHKTGASMLQRSELLNYLTTFSNSCTARSNC
jgi:hypothetical protein